eukprot:IDg9748t1
MGLRFVCLAVFLEPEYFAVAQLPALLCYSVARPKKHCPCRLHTINRICSCLPIAFSLHAVRTDFCNPQGSISMPSISSYYGYLQCMTRWLLRRGHLSDTDNYGNEACTCRMRHNPVAGA